jgi:hypothetical protein
VKLAFKASRLKISLIDLPKTVKWSCVWWRGDLSQGAGADPGAGQHAGGHHGACAAE